MSHVSAGAAGSTTAPDHRNRPGRRALRWVGGGALAVIAAFAVAMVADTALNGDDVPRGAVVGGVEIGGLEPAAAQELLAAELGGRAEAPVAVHAGSRDATFVPSESGLSPDWAATVDRAGQRSLNPVLWVRGFFTTTEVDIAATVDEAAFATALDRVAAELTVAPADGAVVLADGAAQVTDPIIGQNIDRGELSGRMSGSWLDPAGITVRASEVAPAIGPEDVAAAVEGPAAKALESPVVVHGRDGADARIEPARMGEVVTFAPEGEGDGATLVPHVDVEAARGILDEVLSGTEVKMRNASVSLAGGRTVTPSVDGVEVDWEATLDGFADRVIGGEPREVDAVYRDTPATYTTDRAETATFDQVVGEFTTGGYSAASGTNIALTARMVDGAFVAPGETFSLNGHTGPRGSAQGFVESGIILNGRADNAVGGGISQFATTLYNAAYFAGMADVAHTPHSYYISRYPAGREATVFEGAIDLQFKNSSDHPVIIETSAGDGEVTVRFKGVKTVEVESVNGGRWAYTSPRSMALSGSGCTPSGGAQGFTTSDTRIIRSLSGAELSRESQTTVYDPQPIVTCR